MPSMGANRVLVVGFLGLVVFSCLMALPPCECALIMMHKITSPIFVVLQIYVNYIIFISCDDFDIYASKILSSYTLCDTRFANIMLFPSN